MNLNERKKNWDQFVKEEPCWVILMSAHSKDNKWEDFF